MKITITMDIDDSYADPEHPMGVTAAGFDEILDKLGQLGDGIDVERADQ